MELQVDIGKDQVLEWADVCSLMIPTESPTVLSNCRIMDCQYWLKVL